MKFFLSFFEEHGIVIFKKVQANRLFLFLLEMK
jgi:hypothetical protein